MNAICMDKNGDIIDPLNGLRDTKNHIIKTIGNSKKSFRDDALRILRAIRFMITLDFQLDKEIIEAIQETKKYLKNISYERKKVELDKIFASPKAKEGIEVLKQLDLIEALDLENIDRIKDYTDLIGIWSMINSKYYRFTKHERELITKVNQVYHFNNEDPKILYRYGLYVNTLAGVNKGMDKKKIAYKYSHLPIKAKSDIDITAFEICELLNKKPGPFLNSIYQSLEDMILSGQLKNKKNDIITYIKMNVVKE